MFPQSKNDKYYGINLIKNKELYDNLMSDAYWKNIEKNKKKTNNSTLDLSNMQILSSQRPTLNINMLKKKSVSF